MAFCIFISLFEHCTVTRNQIPDKIIDFVNLVNLDWWFLVEVFLLAILDPVRTTIRMYLCAKKFILKCWFFKDLAPKLIHQQTHRSPVAGRQHLCVFLWWCLPRVYLGLYNVDYFCLNVLDVVQACWPLQKLQRAKRRIQLRLKYFCTIAKEVTEAIVSSKFLSNIVLLNHSASTSGLHRQAFLPITTEQLKESATATERRTGYPPAVGFLEGKHICIAVWLSLVFDLLTFESLHF